MSFKKAKQPEKVQEHLSAYLSDRAVCSMDEFIQHGTTTTLEHCLSVVSASCAIAKKLHLRVNYENLTLGALLHDFYLYDWHTHQDEGALHGFAHPHIACRNAAARFHISPEVQHIIRTHMWPLTLRFVPRSREAIIVCLADKYCSTVETVSGFWHHARALGQKRRV